MAAQFTKEAMAARLPDVQAEIKAIMDKVTPLREARDAYAREADAKRKQMDAAIVAAEEGLFDLRNEESVIARALGGKSLNGQSA